jgi:amino acid transporter
MSDPSAPDHWSSDDRAPEPDKMSSSRLVLFCLLTPATAVAAFGLIVSLQVELTGDSGSHWPHGWTSVIQCAIALAVVGGALAWIVWSERERLGAAIRR